METNNDTVANLNVTSENSSVHFEEESIPIDMQFNAGHVVSISVYAVLFVLSSAGKSCILLLPILKLTIL